MPSNHEIMPRTIDTRSEPCRALTCNHGERRYLAEHPVPGRLRSDTAMFLRHVVHHIEFQLRIAARGQIDLGDPIQAAEALVLQVREHACTYTELAGNSDKPEP